MTSSPRAAVPRCASAVPALRPTSTAGQPDASCCSRARTSSGAIRCRSGSVLCTSAFLIRAGRPRRRAERRPLRRAAQGPHDRATQCRAAPAAPAGDRARRRPAQCRAHEAARRPRRAGAIRAPLDPRPPSWTAARPVRRGSVAGTARPTPGRRVCFTGRTSGVDQCGVILGGAARRDQRDCQQARGDARGLHVGHGPRGRQRRAGLQLARGGRQRARRRHHDARLRPAADDVLHADHARARRAARTAGHRALSRRTIPTTPP